MRRWLRRFIVLRIKPFTRDPRTQLATAIILIITGLFEIFEDVADELLGWKIGIEHGVLLFGLMNALYALAQIVEGVEGLKVQTLEGEVREVEREVQEVRRDRSGGE